MRNRFFFLFLMLIPCFLFAQEGEVVSIHQAESLRYADLNPSGGDVFDSINSFRLVGPTLTEYAPLQRRVFGYHPFWGGSTYLNYQWGLLSDFCHFSYEVDPATGYPLTTHDWETSPAIDSAMANGVKVHLCVTLFSGHTLFFSNPAARQNLIDQVILLVSSREAHGVNMDVEALPSSQKEAFLSFMIDLCEQMDQQLPEAEVSIAAPAINWSEKFNIPVLNEHIDFFMVMGYDYYWGGSAVAGPVSPLYPMSGNYTYTFSRTISYYQSQGVPSTRLIMGVPYYAYQWKTEGQYAPSNTIGTGAAYTYRNVMDNTSGNYSPQNKHLENSSFAPYFSFETNGWNQCFLDDPYSLGEKYDIVNRRDLAGIGIWALGYDDGHMELWNLIAEKFTTGAQAVNADTLYDTGGPDFDYYDDEDYVYTLASAPGSRIYLSFSSLDTEENYDTLWIHDGPDQSAVLYGVYTGDDVPPLIHSTANSLTLRFVSDGSTTDAGWRAVYDTLPVSGIDGVVFRDDPLVRPNPATGVITIEIVDRQTEFVQILDARGHVKVGSIPVAGRDWVSVSTASWDPGLYVVLCFIDRKPAGSVKFIVN